MRSITATSKGIGLRSEHLTALYHAPKFADIDFLELAPENWMGIGGEKQEILECLAEKYPLIAHGLSLSVGDTQPLNREFIRHVAAFLERYHIEIYSDHLCFSRDRQGYLYDLLPLPRHKENIDYIADRIHAVQDIIQRPLVLENITYYHCYENEIPEYAFFNALLEKTNCKLLLDINNIYVNSRNHHYDPAVFLREIAGESIAYYHIAGHLAQKHHFILDTHGKPVSQDVIELGHQCFLRYGPRPLLLERDHFLPTLAELRDELVSIQTTLLRRDDNECAPLSAG
ncbi:DUF692 domain-containing protein [Enterobacteriaceae bacterium LUAb1]